MEKFRLVLAQINPVVGDLPGNIKKIISFIRKARQFKPDIVAFPELAVTGYPPEDLLLKPQFVQDNVEYMHRIVPATEGITAVVGFVDRNEGLYNAAAVISDGRIVDIYHKIQLPNYGVFDEYRYFTPGDRYPLYDIGGVKVGVTVCEDIWQEVSPVRVQAMAGAEIIININASPYSTGKPRQRDERVTSLCKEGKSAIAYLNMIGGQDELIFDGGSFVADAEGRILARGKSFREDLIPVDIDIHGSNKHTSPGAGKELKRIIPKDRYVDNIAIPLRSVKRKPEIRKKNARLLPEEEEIYSALLLGTRDYVRKNGFNGVVIGMSGGVDSALVTTIAVDALGKENVRALFMPSMYTSRESYEDAFSHAEALGINIREIPINSVFKSYINVLSKSFRKMEADITEENLQARIRGNILMAFSNKFGWLVLTTGNKSEMSVGYATLYGDMAGGFAVIKDVPKTMVYKLCEWRNKKEGGELIPGRILWKDPSAELKPDQRDTDSLPPYPMLDPILRAYVEEDMSFGRIKEMGCDVACARKVINMIDHSEYKRRQAPPGIKITPRAFGKDRRFPITNKYRSY